MRIQFVFGNGAHALVVDSALCEISRTGNFINFYLESIVSGFIESGSIDAIVDVTSHQFIYQKHQ